MYNPFIWLNYIVHNTQVKLGLVKLFLGVEVYIKYIDLVTKAYNTKVKLALVKLCFECAYIDHILYLPVL